MPVEIHEGGKGLCEDRNTVGQWVKERVQENDGGCNK